MQNSALIVIGLIVCTFLATLMMYFPLQNLCNNATTTTDQRDPSKVYGQIGRAHV